MKRQRDESGKITVLVPLWWEIPIITLKRTIGNTEYSISGSYDGEHSLPSKMLKLIMKDGDTNDGTSSI